MVLIGKWCPLSLWTITSLGACYKCRSVISYDNAGLFIFILSLFVY